MTEQPKISWQTTICVALVCGVLALLIREAFVTKRLAIKTEGEVKSQLVKDTLSCPSKAQLARWKGPPKKKKPKRGKKR